MKLQGYRKLSVYGTSIAALLVGLVIVKNSASAVGLYTPFAAAVVAIGGWFFNKNIEAKKAGVPA